MLVSVNKVSCWLRVHSRSPLTSQTQAQTERARNLLHVCEEPHVLMALHRALLGPALRSSGDGASLPSTELSGGTQCPRATGQFQWHFHKWPQAEPLCIPLPHGCLGRKPSEGQGCRRGPRAVWGENGRSSKDPRQPLGSTLPITCTQPSQCDPNAHASIQIPSAVPGYSPAQGEPPPFALPIACALARLNQLPSLLSKELS